MLLITLPEQWLCVVYDAFTGVVIGVGKEDVPVPRQSLRVDSEAVVLTGDEAAICSLVDARLVVTTVAVSEIEDQITEFINCSLEKQHFSQNNLSFSFTFALT